MNNFQLLITRSLGSSVSNACSFNSLILSLRFWTSVGGLAFLGAASFLPLAVFVFPVALVVDDLVGFAAAERVLLGLVVVASVFDSVAAFLERVAA